MFIIINLLFNIVKHNDLSVQVEVSFYWDVAL